ncbi:hypothetical protein [Afifella sp. YEN Y35]|uniref:hypothetical protein n=1 Tax=Afifella sp. YEN Y35 TaxID=3388337 RepID=UPI0039E0D9EC
MRNPLDNSQNAYRPAKIYSASGDADRPLPVYFSGDINAPRVPQDAFGLFGPSPAERRRRRRGHVALTLALAAILTLAAASIALMADPALDPALGEKLAVTAFVAGFAAVGALLVAFAISVVQSGQGRS